MRNATEKTKIVLGIKIHEACERDLPKGVVGSCYRYTEVCGLRILDVCLLQILFCLCLHDMS